MPAEVITFHELEHQACEIEAECKGFGFHQCIRCHKWHCSTHTSNVDVSCCINCCEPVEVTTSIQRKDEEEYDEWNDEVKLTTRECKNIHFSGKHWLSNSVVIAELSDTKLKSSIEYHKGMVTAMEAELMTRRIEKSKAQYGFPTAGKHIRRKIAPSDQITEEHTKTTRLKKAKDPFEQLSALISSGKMTLEQAMQMLGGGKIPDATGTK